MRAEVKHLHSPDIDGDLENYTPDERDDFCLLFQAFIGTAGTKGEDSFNFLVCTPKWIERDLEKYGFLLGRGYSIIVKRYDFTQIQKIIQDLCRRVSGDSWEEIARKLGLYGHWEFEDYKP